MSTDGTGRIERLWTIGEVAERAGVATSTVRFYERRGLLTADGRVSGQRRYRDETMRRLIFIGMLQDAGLSLDDIAGILASPTVADWKAIARARLDALESEIAQLSLARDYLAGALLCRFDHPMTDCAIMGAEIDRRVAQPPPVERPNSAAGRRRPAPPRSRNRLGGPTATA